MHEPWIFIFRGANRCVDWIKKGRHHNSIMRLLSGIMNANESEGYDAYSYFVLV